MASCKSMVCLGKEHICKNCIKADVCKVAEEFEKEPVDGMYIEGCDYFKDRNRFVELPTTLGKEFYTIERYGDKKRVRWCFAEEITICTVRGIKNGRYVVLENCFDFKVKPLRKKTITDMSNIFQTYEEAEKALKERKNNET